MGAYGCASTPWLPLQKVSGVAVDMIENQTFIENRTFNEIQIGESASLVFVIVVLCSYTKD